MTEYMGLTARRVLEDGEKLVDYGLGAFEDKFIRDMMTKAELWDREFTMTTKQLKLWRRILNDTGVC